VLKKEPSRNYDCNSILISEIYDFVLLVAEDSCIIFKQRSIFQTHYESKMVSIFSVARRLRAILFSGAWERGQSRSSLTEASCGSWGRDPYEQTKQDEALSNKIETLSIIAQHRGKW
jgi:hypothetical protein